MLAATAAGMGVLVARAAFLARRMPRVVLGTAGGAVADASGVAPGAGTEGVARTALVPVGSVLAAGEDWSAIAAGGAAVERGDRVRVVGRHGLTLIVEPLDGMASSGASSLDTPATMASRP
jgi:membrane-bound ClpP family serine protease